MRYGNLVHKTMRRTILLGMIFKKICGSRYKLNASIASAEPYWNAAATSASSRPMDNREYSDFAFFRFIKNRFDQNGS